MEFTIKAEKLTKSYGSLKALDQFDLSVGKGEIFGLLGSNGAGKSTALECILGTRKPDSGTSVILGMNPFFRISLKWFHFGVFSGIFAGDDIHV